MCFVPPRADPILQLDALVAVAHDIPALHRVEHPGKDADNLGADDFLPIFIYVLANSNVDGLAAQSLVVETLCDPKRLMGEAGLLRLVLLAVDYCRAPCFSYYGVV